MHVRKIQQQVHKRVCKNIFSYIYIYTHVCDIITYYMCIYAAKQSRGSTCQWSRLAMLFNNMKMKEMKKHGLKKKQKQKHMQQNTK